MKKQFLGGESPKKSGLDSFKISERLGKKEGVMFLRGVWGRRGETPMHTMS